MCRKEKRKEEDARDARERLKSLEIGRGNGTGVTEEIECPEIFLFKIWSYAVTRKLSGKDAD